MIPQTIHQMFIPPHTGGENGMGDDVRAHGAEWDRRHPHYHRRVWSLAEFLSLCESIGRSDVAGAVRACRLPAMQTDIARLLILREFGGFWADLKLYPLASFLDSLRSPSILFAEHFQNEGWHPGMPCSAFLASEAHHKFFDTALSAALRTVDDRSPHVVTVGGPAAIEAAITEHFGDSFSERGYMIPHDMFWGVLVGSGSASYNGADNSLHWSNRQGREPLYVWDEVQEDRPVSREEIVLAYRLLLGRRPSETEVSLWRDVRSLEALRATCLRSDEFRASLQMG